MKSTQLKSLIILGLALTACNSNYKLDTVAPGNTNQSTGGSGGGSGGGSSGGGTTCTIQNVTQNLRILFMVDDSGSTATTDPNYTNRVATIQNFLTKYANQTNLTYSYNYFGTNVATYNVVSDSFGNITSSGVFGTASNAESALNAFQLIGTVGNTNYSAAFTRLEAIIGGDIAANTNENYVVIFMSDGQPTDQGSSASDQIAGITNISNALMSYAPSGRITLSTVYFGAPDNQAETNLETMASIGGGQFINTNLTTQYSIDNLISVPVKACN
jgi:hypothetical protein